MGTAYKGNNPLQLNCGSATTVNSPNNCIFPKKKLGKQQEYQLGQYLRQRYGDYINASYIPGEIYALSSEVDRTIMSGLLALAGMFPTNNQSSWDENVNWQPVPLRTIPTAQDNVSLKMTPILSKPT